MKRRELLARQPSYCKILNDLKEIFNIYNLFSSTFASKYPKKTLKIGVTKNGAMFKMASQKMAPFLKMASHKWRHV